MKVTIEHDAALTHINAGTWEEDEMDFLRELTMAVKYERPAEFEMEDDDG